MGLGFLLTDELFSVLSNKRAYLTKCRLYYALGAGGSFYLAWNMWTAIGIIAGTSLPDLTQLGLDFAIAAIFIALVVPEIKSIPILICVIMSAVSAVVFSIYQNDLALISAALVGMASGFLYKRMEDKP